MIGFGRTHKIERLPFDLCRVARTDRYFWFRFTEYVDLVRPDRSYKESDSQYCTKCLSTLDKCVQIEGRYRLIDED